VYSTATIFLIICACFDSLVELPAYVGSIFMMDKIGRKPTLGWSLLLGGAACLTAGLIPEGVHFLLYNVVS